MTAVAQPIIPRRATVTAAVWLILAIIAGTTGFLVQLPFPGAQLIILGLTAAAVVAVLAPSSVRAWVESVPLRWLVGVNASRFVGIAFLVAAAQGHLNPVFAARAGWGDIAVAASALVLALVTAPRSLLIAWNLLGTLDLVVAVATATFVPDVSALLTFPLSLIPTFAVPVLFAIHAVIFRRLIRDGR